MKVEVISAELYADEHLRIWKNHFEPAGQAAGGTTCGVTANGEPGAAEDAKETVPAGGATSATSATSPAPGATGAAAGGMKRISIVTGIHGDELEGQFVAFELARRIQERPDLLAGVVDIYPAINPLGISSIMRSVPLFDLDMNRIFPGNEEGDLVEHVAKAVVDDVAGSDLALDIHASNVFLTEIPQIRINEVSARTLMPYALKANVDYLWVHSSATVLRNTFAYSLNEIGTPTLVVEMGVGMRITREYGYQLVDGIFNLMCELGIWTGPAPEGIRRPIVSTDGEVSFINADAAGIFLPSVRHENFVRAGEELGRIADATTGQVNQVLKSPVDGLLFTLREYPVVYPGSLIARILGGVDEEGRSTGANLVTSKDYQDMRDRAKLALEVEAEQRAWDARARGRANEEAAKTNPPAHAAGPDATPDVHTTAPAGKTADPGASATDSQKDDVRELERPADAPNHPMIGKDEE